MASLARTRARGVTFDGPDGAAARRPRPAAALRRLAETGVGWGFCGRYPPSPRLPPAPPLRRSERAAECNWASHRVA